VIEFHYQAEKWNKPRRIVCKIEWHVGELFPRVGFIVTNSNLEAHKVITIYNGQGGVSCQKVVRPRCVGFFPRTLLSHLIRLTPSLPDGRRNESTN